MRKAKRGYTLKRFLFAGVIASGPIALLLPADLAIAAHDPASDEFRSALFATCNAKPVAAKDNCLRSRTVVYDMRNTDAREKRNACLKNGGAPALCEAKQERYWKDLKKMFGL